MLLPVPPPPRSVHWEARPPARSPPSGVLFLAAASQLALPPVKCVFNTRRTEAWGHVLQRLRRVAGNRSMGRICHRRPRGGQGGRGTGLCAGHPFGPPEAAGSEDIVGVGGRIGPLAGRGLIRVSNAGSPAGGPCAVSPTRGARLGAPIPSLVSRHR